MKDLVALLTAIGMILTIVFLAGLAALLPYLVLAWLIKLIFF